MDATFQESGTPLQQNPFQAAAPCFANVHSHVKHSLQALSAMAAMLIRVQIPSLSSLLQRLLL